MYRAITLFALSHQVAMEDARALGAIAAKVTMEFKMDGDINRLFLNGEDVTEAIRSPEVTENVSEVSSYREVREAMVARQQEMAKNGNVVAEGRDTTSVVFPDADLKIYLEASVKERARRRLIDFTHQGISSSIEEQMELLNKRDSFDSGRRNSPLTKTRDSITIDTTNLNIEEQVEKIIRLFKTNLRRV